MVLKCFEKGLPLRNHSLYGHLSSEDSDLVFLLVHPHTVLLAGFKQILPGKSVEQAV